MKKIADGALFPVPGTVGYFTLTRTIGVSREAVQDAKAITDTASDRRLRRGRRRRRTSTQARRC